MRRLLLLALAAGVTHLVGVPTVATAAPSPLFPDLKTLPPRQLKLDRTDVAGVLHNVLRFSNSVVNLGQGALILDADIDPVTRTGPATQQVMADDGSTFASYPAGSMYWHETHQHYHLDDWGVYQLWNLADYDKWISTGRAQGLAKKVGSKTTSCVLDEEFVANLPGTPYPATYYGGCLPITGHLRQVLSPGWGDTYDYYRSEQWIDLDQERLADGQYVLRSASDPKNRIFESPGKADQAREGPADNEATTAFTVAGGALLDGSPPSGTVSINHIDATTQATAVSVDVLGRDDVSGVDQLRLSNDGTTWTSPYPYTSGDGSVPTTVGWDLADPRYGGNARGGSRLVFAQTHDRSGKWSSTFTDTINVLTAPPPLTTGYGAVVAGDGPVSYWRLGESSAAAATDSVGTNVGTYRNGVSLGAASLLTSDPQDRSAAFDGVDDVVTVPSSVALSPTAAVTVEAWVRPSVIPPAGTFASLVTKAESYSLQLNGPRLEFTTIRSGVRRRVQAPVGAVVAGQTYHVVGTYDGTTQRLYLGGVQVAWGAFTGAVSATTTSVTLASWDATSEFLSGSIDEVAIYATPLTAARVSAHFAQGSGGVPAPPPSHTVTVLKGGGGSGAVTSGFPVGISCGTTCTATVVDGTSLSLSAAPLAGSSFASWSGGGCAGTGQCTTVVLADIAITATFGLVAPAPTTGYAAAVLGDGPASYWRLGDVAPPLAADSAGSSPGTYLNGVGVGAASLLRSDAANRAASFDGVNDVLSVPSTASLSPTAAVTIEAWVRPDALPAPGGFASLATKAESCSLQLNGPRLEFTTMRGGIRRRVQAPIGAVVVGQSYYVAATYDGTTQRLYLNGVLVASGAFSGALGVNSNRWAIGSWDTVSEFLSGTLDEVAVYARVLTPGQIANHSTLANASP